MSAVLAPPLAASGTPSITPRPAPVPLRWTLTEYRELGKTGLFHDKKTMLIDGEIIVMVMPNPPHNVALGLADAWLRTVFVTGHHVRNQMGFDVGSRNDPGPDLVVVAGCIRDYVRQNPTTAILVIEVADSTLFFDTTTKAELYATAGVPDYWVIDVEHGQLIVFRDPEPLPAALGANAYRQRHTYGPADSVSPLAAPDAVVTVADLLP